MRREKVFNKGGAYHLIVDKNILLHREAAASATKAVHNLLKTRADNQEIDVLDLACGGAPISLCSVISHFSERSFNYTGVDINPDQVEKLKNDFEFPPNVIGVGVFEGNAWDLSWLGSRKFDFVYTGLNLHHGSAEEVFCLMTQLKRLLNEGGLFLNHDMYRPNETSYMKRPDVNPNDPAEFYALIPEAKLSQYAIPSFNFERDRDHGDWRLEFLPQLKQVMTERGISESEVKSTLEHVYNRDYCFSTREMKTVIEEAGFEVIVHNYDQSPEPLRNYYAMLEAHPIEC